MVNRYSLKSKNQVIRVMVMTARTEFLYESNIGKRKFAFLPWALEELKEP